MTPEAIDTSSMASPPPAQTAVPPPPEAAADQPAVMAQLQVASMLNGSSANSEVAGAVLRTQATEQAWYRVTCRSSGHTVLLVVFGAGAAS